MTNDEQQEHEELAVFRAFAGVCKSLMLLPETAIKLPDRKHEPDIRCELSSGELFTFELVQSEDVTRDDSHPDGFSSIMPKRLAAKIDLENALAKSWRDALDEQRIDQPDRFKFHSATVYLVNRFPSKNSRNAVAKRIVVYLNANGPGSYRVKDPIVWSIRCEPVPQHFRVDGPMSFHVPSGGGARVNIVEPIKSKLSNPYHSLHPIHLLAWSTTADPSEFEFTGQRDQLVQWLSLNGLGPFTRAWIFGYGDKSIVFDSAKMI